MSPIRATPPFQPSFPQTAFQTTANQLHKNQELHLSPQQQNVSSAPQTLSLTQYASEFARGLTQLSTIGAYASSQRAHHAAQGIGIFQGAQQTAGAVMHGAQILEKLSPQTPTPFEQVGSWGQEYNMAALSESLYKYAGKELGLDISKASTKELAQAALRWFSGNATTTTASSTTSAASTLLQTEARLAPIAASGSTSLVSTIGNAAGLAGAAYSAYGLISNFGKSDPVTGAVQGAATGAYIGSIIPGIGTLIGGAVGAVVGGALGFIKTGKHKDQLARDNVRDFLSERGVLTKNHEITLADGTTYNIGVDGGHKLTNTDGTTRNAYDVDFSNPLASTVVGWIQPLVALLTGGNGKLKDDFTGYFTNAALSNATDLASAKANVVALYQQTQATPQIVLSGLSALGNNNVITKEVYSAFVGGIQDLFTEHRVPQQIESVK